MKTFLAYLDILGFSELVQHNSEDELCRIVESFFKGFNEAIEQSRTLYGTDSKTHADIYETISIEKLHFYLFSDSILIWIDNGADHNEFRNLLFATSYLLGYGLKNGLPLRGVITYGELITHSSSANTKCEVQDAKTRFFTNEAIYGKALVEAHSREKKMDWSGCLLTPNAWKQFMCIWDKRYILRYTPLSDITYNAYFRTYPYFIWYPIPFKKCYATGIALNWSYAQAPHLQLKFNSYVLASSFGAYRKGLPTDSVTRKKLDETLKFFEYCRSLCEYCFPERYPEDLCSLESQPDLAHNNSPEMPSKHELYERRGSIPIPDDDYSLDSLICRVKITAVASLTSSQSSSSSFTSTDDRER